MDMDDSMLSTPSSHPEDNEDDTFAQDDEEEDDENLFPSSTQNPAHVPAQIPQNDHLNAAAPGELSPPRSQSIDGGNGVNGFSGQQPRSAMGGTGDMMGDDDDDDEGVDMAGSGMLSSSGAAGGGRGGDGQDTSGAYKPGAAWKSKKAQDEMQRAWDQCVDRDFSLKEYGDVMAARVQVSS